MDEKKSIKVSLGTVVCIFIIFILIIALIWMYVHYNYISDNNNTSNIEDTVNTNNIITNTESSNNQAIAKSLDIDSQEVKRLYKYILKFNYYHETLVYQENKVTYNNIDNQLKLLTIFDNLDENQAQKVKTDDYTCVVEDDGNSYKYLYTKETVEAKAKEIFGKNATVVHENCSPYDSYSRIYEDGIYTCFSYAGGGDVPWSSSRNILLKAETDGNNIYLYDTYIHLVSVDNIINGVNHYGTFDIYATSDRKVSIAEKVDLEKNGVYEGTENLSGDAYDSKYISNLLNIIDNKNKTFKHTFSKDSNGNYYWVSTEIVD